MSTFVGRMREYVDVSIDRFDGINLDSNAYFLSHNHADHTVGLASGTLRYRLQSEHRLKLYCSEVTHHLLLCFDKYKHLANSLVALPLNETCIISIPDILTGKEKYKLNVTLLPAGHCPGSVMFLFEGHEETVLYTGDFRLDHGDISRIEALKSGNGPKELKSLYIDTTFCVPAALFIPSRDESSNAVIGIAEEWISQSRRHTVVIKYKALLGYEDLFRRLSEHFNMKVHVTNEKYEQYLGLTDLSKFTTPHPEDTQIHACKYPSSRTGKSALPCGYTPTSATGGDPLPVRTIYVSTMAFVQSVPPEAYARRYNEKSFHVCYSFHSSYGELREVIFFLRPHHAFPNVIPMGDTMPQIQERLNSLAELARRSLQPRSPRQYRELGKLKRKRKWRRPMTQNFEHSENLDFGELESSPEKRLCSNSRQPVKTRFPLLMGGSDCEELSTEISTDHKASAQERHSSDQDSSYQPSDTEPLNASLDLFDDEENVLEEEKNVMLSFTPTKGGSYGEFAFYVSDDEEEDGMSLAPGVDRLPDVEPTKAEELCAAKSQKSENGFIVNKLKTDLEVHGQKAPWDSVAGELKETTVQKAMNVETRPELTCGVKSVADSKAVTPETTGTAAASDVESVVDTGKEERQRNAAEDAESIKSAADETNSKESNEHKEVSESTASHPSKVSRDSETSGNDGSKSNMATATTELPQCKTQRRTEEPKADVSSTTRTPPEEAASAGHDGASATVSHCRDENVVSAAGDSQNTNKLGAVSEVDTQDVSSSIKSHGKEGRESERRDEALGESGKCHGGDTLEKKNTSDEPKLTESGESSEKTGTSADIPKKVNAVVLPASQKRESSVNGKSKKRDSTEQVNGDPAIQMKQRGNEVTAQVSGQHRDVSVINWTDDVIVIDDDDTAPAAASGPRWPNNMTVDITCQTTDSDSTIDPTEGVIPPGCSSTVRPAVRNSDGAVLAVSGLMLDDTTTSTSDSYTSPGERRRRRRRWHKTRWSNTSPGDSSYFRRRLAGNNPGPSGSKSRLSGGDGGATIDLTSGDDTEAPAEGGDACDVDTASGVVTFDGYYADNEDGQSDSTAGEWDEADSPLFKAKRDHSRDTVISDVDDVIVLDDDTSDDCANKNDDVASEHCTRTVVHNPIAVPDGTVEK